MGQAGEILSKIQMDPHENFAQETVERFKSDPDFYREFVKKIEAEVNNAFPVVSMILLAMSREPRYLTRFSRSSHRVRFRPSRAQRSLST
jgi:hypothetical protein